MENALMYRRILTVLLAMAAFVLATATAQAAVVLSLDAGGKLVSASGVVVGGQTYDVAFVDGKCIDLFSDCLTGAPNSFMFHNITDSLAASQALLDQVFRDVGQGNFDSDLSLTAACHSSLICDAVTAYSTHLFNGTDFVDSTAARNVPGSGDTTVAGEITFETNFQLGGAAGVGPNLFWAVWAPAATSSNVPEPGTLTLVGLAALVMAARNRRRGD